ncbi:hypothetical protein GCM10010123_00070 [Pilimelia anulata]|uniref:DUF4360 domain-containing protein n=1 Tax=Pilimelia anulata TaxID=53371 RepID=A0A8J3FAF7_9ACTN|nr:DUF4360 domain-containing protein [Pilimelia anulata]GGJ74114.1 hypothetical protein GCM10010123_00070 [Pilimelia anulata]
MEMMMKAFMAATGVAAMLTSTTLLGAPAMAQDDPADVPVTVKLTTANGTGCKGPDHGVAVKSYPTGVVQINLPKMQAKAGRNNPATSTLTCTTNLAVSVPEGYTWALDAVGVKGFAYLDETTSGKAFVSAYLAGLTATGTVDTALEGEYSGRWVQLDAPSEEVKQPCGESRALNVTTRVNANAGSDPKRHQAIMTLRSSNADDHDVLLGLRTIKCSE